MCDPLLAPSLDSWKNRVTAKERQYGISRGKYLYPQHLPNTFLFEGQATIANAQCQQNRKLWQTGIHDSYSAIQRMSGPPLALSLDRWKNPATASLEGILGAGVVAAVCSQ